MTRSHWLKKVRETQFPKCYIIAQPYELTSRTNNTVTTGKWSLKWKRDSSHTPCRQWQRQRRVTDDTKSSWATPCQQQNTMKSAERRHRLQQQSYNTTPQHQTCDASQQQTSTSHQCRHGSNGVNWRKVKNKDELKIWWSDDKMNWQYVTDNRQLTIDDRPLTVDDRPLSPATRIYCLKCPLPSNNSISCVPPCTLYMPSYKIR